jgi:predicted methyltransferase
MTCIQALLSLLLISPCTDGGGGSLDVVIAEALASPERLAEDRSRDPLRKPDQVLAFFEIKPGMRVLDLFSGGGYYTEILNYLVGPTGSVISQNNQAYLDYLKDENTARYKDDRLHNVERLIVEADDLNLPDASIDATLAILTWHDFYYGGDGAGGWPAVDESALVDKLCKAMKPGAVLGIIDHVAPAGSDPAVSGEELHRVDPERIKADLSSSCFVLQGEAQFLRNPADPLDLVVMDPAIRGKSDRVVLKYRRSE